MTKYMDIELSNSYVLFVRGNMHTFIILIYFLNLYAIPAKKT